MVYAHRRGSRRHEDALRALAGVTARDELWGLPVFVVGEFLRVVTHPSILRPPSTLEIAVESIDALVNRSNSVVLNPGPRFWDLLRTTMVEARAHGNLAADAQIVAVCREHGVDEILTEDRDFARFDGIRVRTLDGFEP